MLIQLRPYQEEAIARLRARIGEGIRRLILVMATGSGKTSVAAAIIWFALQMGNRSIFVAHRRELIKQCFCKLVRNGIPPHEIGIVMAGVPASASGALFSALDPQLSDDDLWKMFARTRPNAPIQVASIDTLRGRSKPLANIVIIDECLPAGTLVSGAPIETLKVGDMVEAFDHETGRTVLRRVEHLFKSRPSRMVRVVLADGRSICATGSHPFYTQRGYVSAESLSSADLIAESHAKEIHHSQELRDLRSDVHAEVVEPGDDPNVFTGVQSGSDAREDAPRSPMPRMRHDRDHVRQGEVEDLGRRSVLLGSVQAGQARPQESDLRKTTRELEPEARSEAHAGKQPHAGPWNARADAANLARYELGAEDPRRERQGTPSAARDACPRVVHADGVRCPDWDSADARRLAEPLQARHRRSDHQTGDRGGRAESLPGIATRVRPSEGRVLTWTRVDRIEVLQPGSDGTFGGVCPDGYVYNIEVEGVHNFFANGFLTHNCHRSVAKSYLSLIESYPNAVFLGLTATPYRADGRGLDQFYQHLEVVASPSMLMREGYLVEPQIWTVPGDRLPDLSKVKIKDGDYDEEQLAEVMDQSALVGDIVDHWERRAGGVRTVVFAAGINHSKHIASRFVARGIPAEHLDGETPTDEREAIFARLERGETLVLCNVFVCVEGWDMPAVKCCVQARPTQSTMVHLQQAGRILRPWNGHIATILDHAGNMRVHGRPQDDREFSLEGRKKRGSSVGAPSCKTCECLAVLPSATRICPMCGHQFSAVASERSAPEEREGELVQIPRSIAVANDHVEQWNALVERWHKQNRSRNVPLKPGWVAMEFKTRTGLSRIPDGCTLPTLTSEQQAKLERFGELNRYAHAQGWSPARLHAVFKAQEKTS